MVGRIRRFFIKRWAKKEMLRKEAAGEPSPCLGEIIEDLEHYFDEAEKEGFESQEFIKHTRKLIRDLRITEDLDSPATKENLDEIIARKLAR